VAEIWVRLWSSSTWGGWRWGICKSIALQCAQAIVVLHQAAALGRGSSSLPHIIVSAPSSLTNLWQTKVFLCQVFFVIVDRHSYRSYLHQVFSFCFADCLLSFFLSVVSTCALICLVLFMDGFQSLIFIDRVFPFVSYTTQNCGRIGGWLLL
jgi:hypothetical protein